MKERSSLPQNRPILEGVLEPMEVRIQRFNKPVRDFIRRWNALRSPVYGEDVREDMRQRNARTYREIKRERDAGKPSSWQQLSEWGKWIMQKQMAKASEEKKGVL